MRLFEKLDELNKALLGLAVVLLLAAFVAGGNQTLTLVFRLLFALCVLLAVYRIFGQRPDKRNQENMVFCAWSRKYGISSGIWVKREALPEEP